MEKVTKHECRLAAMKMAEDAFRADGCNVHFTLDSFDERYVTVRDGRRLEICIHVSRKPISGSDVHPLYSPMIFSMSVTGIVCSRLESFSCKE